MIHSIIHSTLSLRTRTKPNSNLVMEAGPKEAQMPKEENLSDTSKCTDAMIFEYFRKYNISKSVGGKVEYGYLKSVRISFVDIFMMVT